jgi:hypothetical protein
MPPAPPAPPVPAVPLIGLLPEDSSVPPQPIIAMAAAATAVDAQLA